MKRNMQIAVAARTLDFKALELMAPGASPGGIVLHL
jgi:hypothetical protein